MDYNETVHLPQTDFPMRAGLPKREPEMLDALQSLYHKMVARNEGKPKFVLHDGPPYANGNIHIGTAMNKILKDITVKSTNMTGFYAPYVPGWDTHGLPIETAVLKDKSVKREEMSTADFRTKCQEYAEGYIARMTEQFKRLGVLGEWENPYITLLPEFEARQIEVFGKMAEKGLIYKGMKSVYWCPHDQTALAEAEIEYQDHPCTTIFVKFPVRDDKGKLSQYGDLSKMYFVIWTTTPWTIPGNFAICVNAEFDYVLLKAPNGEVYILAQELAQTEAAANFSGLILGTMMGATLVFTIPVALSIIKPEDRPYLGAGTLAGLITIPIGCIAGGLAMAMTPYPMDLLAIFRNLIPVILIAALIVLGLWFAPAKMIAGFNHFGAGVTAVITVFTAIAVFQYQTGIHFPLFNLMVEAESEGGLMPLEEGLLVCGQIAVVLIGAFPMVKWITKTFGKALGKLGKALGMNESGSAGLVATLANNIAMFNSFGEMNEKGKLLNVAFAVGASFVFGDHLGFTAGVNQDMIFPMIIGKVVAGVTALILCSWLSPKLLSKIQDSRGGKR